MVLIFVLLFWSWSWSYEFGLVYMTGSQTAVLVTSYVIQGTFGGGA